MDQRFAINMTRNTAKFSVFLFWVLGCTLPQSAQAQMGAGVQSSTTPTGQTQLDQRPDLTTDLQDPVLQLRVIYQRREIVREPGDSVNTRRVLG